MNMTARMHCCPLCGSSIVNAQKVLFDDDSGFLVCNGQVVQLTRQESTIFSTLLGDWPKIATNFQIYEALYPVEADEREPRIVKCVISKMRKKLQSTGIEIAAVWGRGYRLVLPERKEEP